MKLYVGTYAKYNRGSLAGAWLDLDKFKDDRDFEMACLRLHRDEREPELMFQDVETDPGEDWQEGLYSECSIPRDYWKLKAQAAAEKAQAEAKQPKRVKAEQAEQARLCEAYTELCEGYTRTDKPKAFDKWYKYHLASCWYVALADGIIIPIEKPSIQTRFCCGEDDRGQGGEGPGTMAYAHKVLEAKRTERGFKAANLEPFDSRMVHVAGRKAWRRAQAFARGEIKAGDFGYRPDFVPCLARGACVDRKRVYLQTAHSLTRSEEVYRPLTDDDMHRLRKGYMIVRNAFKRRLDAYWKRYGDSKLHTWTYWTEA